MIRITEGGLADLWPEQDVEIQALSYAIKQALDAARKAADTTQIYANISKVPEDILDHLAVELRTMYYDQAFDIETKRTIIEKTLKWFTKAGTVSAVKELLTVAFGSGDLEEWFDYGGDPKHFNAVLPIGDGQAVESMIKFRSLIESIKNVRSRLDDLIFEEKTRIELKTKEGAYKTDPPLCGTFPDLSTAFRHNVSTISLQTAELGAEASPPMPSDTENTGTAPDTSTGYSGDSAAIQMGSADRGFDTAPAQAEDTLAAGTTPSTSTGYEGEQVGINIQSADQGNEAPMPQAGDSQDTGTHPVQSAGFAADHSEIAAGTGSAQGGSIAPIAGETTTGE